LKYYHTNVENGLTLRRYWTTACPSYPIKSHRTSAKERRITRWEHEHILEAVQRRVDESSPTISLASSTSLEAGC
jgi:hypothetical protein